MNPEKCESCVASKYRVINDALPPHECPYSAELAKGEEPVTCNCCESCQDLCGGDI